MTIKSFKAGYWLPLYPLLLFISLSFLYGELLFAQSLDESLSKKISELKQSSRQVFQSKIKNSRCLNVTQRNSTYNITYRDKSGCEDYERGDYYIGTLKLDGKSFNTGVHLDRPADAGSKFNTIYVGGEQIGYVNYDNTKSCLFIYSQDGKGDRIEFAYDIKNCGRNRNGKNERIYSREIEENKVKTYWYVDSVSSKLRNSSDKSDSRKRIVLDFIYSAEIAKQIPKEILIESNIFSENTYQTFRANLKNFTEKNSLQRNQISLYLGEQNRVSKSDKNNTSGSDSNDYGGWILGLIFFIFIIWGISKLGNKPKSPEEIARDAELDRQRILDEAKARQARLEREEEERKSAEEEQRKLMQGYLDDIKRLISDEQEQKKISEAFLNKQLALGMPKRHVDYLLGEFFEPKESVTKRATKLSGKYIQTGTNSRGNPTYKYEMTFEDGLLAGWKDL